MSNSTTDLIITMMRDLTVKVDAIHTQTIKTNGRVTKLEDITVSLSEHSKTLTALLSKQEGVYTQGLNALEDRLSKVEINDRQIDEFKKNISGESTEITKISTEYSGKIKLTIITGIISLLTIATTAFISYNIGNDKILSDIVTNTNK